MIKAIKGIREIMLEMAKEISSIFNNTINIFENLIENINEYYEKESNKSKHKPILNIKLKKEIILDRRIKNYYCRNDC